MTTGCVYLFLSELRYLFLKPLLDPDFHLNIFWLVWSILKVMLGAGPSAAVQCGHSVGTEPSPKCQAGAQLSRWLLVSYLLND